MEANSDWLSIPVLENSVLQKKFELQHIRFHNSQDRRISMHKTIYIPIQICKGTLIIVVFKKLHLFN